MSYLPGQQQPDAMSGILNDHTLTEEQRQRIIAAMAGMETSMQQDFLASLTGLSGDELDAALTGISRPYDEERDTLRDELAQNYDLLTAEGPKGGVAGNNQFSVYVGASPLEHIASGVGKYMAGKGVKEGREEMRGLNEAQGDATAGMMGARVNAIKARAEADALRNGSPLQSPAPNANNWLEEWLKKGRRP